MKKKGVALRSFHMVLRSQVKKKLKIIPTLPDEIIFKILLLLPADILYTVMRYVCRQWHVIINDRGFVANHLQCSTSILLVQFPKFRYQYLQVGECDINLTDIKFQFPGLVLATCDGLTLVRDREYKTASRPYYIVNPVTNRTMTVPILHFDNVWYRFSLAFAASSNAYKVVVVIHDRRGRNCCSYECAIMTVGVDWAFRRINCRNINNKLKRIFLVDTVVSGGFLYWAFDFFPRMIALNIESEIFKTISVPQPHHQSCGLSYFLRKGNSISFIHVCTDYSISVWVLKDHRTEDWVRFPIFRSEIIKQQVPIATFDLFAIYRDRLYPISWLRNEERILFHTVQGSTDYIVYDVKTGSIFRFTMDSHEEIFPHVSSLTCL